ncbi:MAG: VWA domain-containing protein [Granulosicoccus sp.]|nr:VWA domain-containing protein [Granulosicoccus sp.]
MTGTGIEWLRPAWLWGFLPLLLMMVVWFRQRSGTTAWESVVDPALQPYVIEGVAPASRKAPLWLFAGWALSLLLLAGPVWQQRELPVFEAEQAEVIVFDLSRSMRADDLAPDRLTRARFKLIDLLRRSDGRQTALVAFAERPYVISPLTDDARTIEAFVPSLQPEIMPAQGSRPDLAIARAVQLFEQAEVAAGHVILITDATITERDLEAARLARRAGHRLSVLAVGTAAGSPLRGADGQFLQHSDGAIVVPQLDFGSLSALAEAGGGTAARLSTSGVDLDMIENARQQAAVSADGNEAVAQRIYWVEYSPWFLWILVVLLLSAFRRGIVS